MARSRPVRICAVRQIPSRDPKFHHMEIFEGVGRSIRELFTIFNRGWDFRMFGAIKFLVIGVLWRLGWIVRKILGMF